MTSNASFPEKPDADGGSRDESLPPRAISHGPGRALVTRWHLDGWQPGPAFLLALALLGPLAFAAGWTVDPDPRGHGTHEQWGMQPCGYRTHYDTPCPTCGVTTSLALMARFRILEGVKTQLFGATLFAVVVGLSLAAARALFTRQPLTIPRARSGTGMVVGLVGVVVLLVAWWIKRATWE